MTFRMMTAAEEVCLKTMTAAVCACLRRVNQLKPQAAVDFDHEDWCPLQRYTAAWADASRRTEARRPRRLGGHFAARLKSDPKSCSTRPT